MLKCVGWVISITLSAGPALAREPSWIKGAPAARLLRGWSTRCRGVEKLSLLLDIDPVTRHHLYARKDGVAVWGRMTSQGAGQDGIYSREVWRLDPGRCAGVGYSEDGENHAPLSSLSLLALDQPRPGLEQVITWVVAAPSDEYEIGTWRSLRPGRVDATSDAPARSILRFWAAERKTPTPSSASGKWSLAALDVMEPEQPGRPAALTQTYWTADQLKRLSIEADPASPDTDAWLVEDVGEPEVVARAGERSIYRCATGRAAVLFAAYDAARDRTRWLMALRYRDQGIAKLLGTHDDLLFVVRGEHPELFISQMSTGRTWRFEYPDYVRTYALTSQGLLVGTMDEQGNDRPPRTIGLDELARATR